MSVLSVYVHVPVGGDGGDGIGIEPLIKPDMYPCINALVPSGRITQNPRECVCVREREREREREMELENVRIYRV